MLFAQSVEDRAPFRPEGAIALPRIAADALDVVAELTEIGAPPSVEELGEELDVEDGAARAAILVLREMGFVEPFTDKGEAVRWQSLLRPRNHREFEFVGTFDAPGLVLQVVGAFTEY